MEHCVICNGQWTIGNDRTWRMGNARLCRAPADLVDSKICYSCWISCKDGKELESRIRSAMIKYICRACDNSFKYEFEMVEWIIGDSYYNIGAPPADLKNSLVCKQCFSSAGSTENLEKIIRETDREKLSVANKADEQKINTLEIVEENLKRPQTKEIISISQKPQYDYWTRPMSSLYKNKGFR